ncbi:MAG: hypothetical protein ACR2PS_01715 [Pseudomonadales bacterium]
MLTASPIDHNRRERPKPWFAAALVFQRYVNLLGGITVGIMLKNA